MVNDMTEVFEQSMTDISDWNRIADTYTQMVGVPDDRIYRQFEAVLWEGLGDLRGAEVLDVGCGHGWLSNTCMKLELGFGVWMVLRSCCNGRAQPTLALSSQNAIWRMGCLKPSDDLTV